MRRRVMMLAAACLAVAGCGGKTELIKVEVPTSGVQAKTPQAGQKLGFPAVATKNTTRVAGGDPVADAAGVALAVYPSAAAGTHPPSVVVAPTEDWEASLASSVLMAAPLKAPLLLSTASSMPKASADALKQLAPSGSRTIGGAQIVRVGDVATPSAQKSTSISGSDAFAL